MTINREFLMFLYNYLHRGNVAKKIQILFQTSILSFQEFTKFWLNSIQIFKFPAYKPKGSFAHANWVHFHVSPAYKNRIISVDGSLWFRYKLFIIYYPESVWMNCEFSFYLQWILNWVFWIFGTQQHIISHHRWEHVSIEDFWSILFNLGS